jgi:hypothetical protein
MPDERPSTIIPTTAEPTSHLRIMKLLSGSPIQKSKQVVIPAYRSKSSREVAEQPLLICVIFAAHD